jgi:hypothetical protein
MPNYIKCSVCGCLHEPRLNLAAKKTNIYYVCGIKCLIKHPHFSKKDVIIYELTEEEKKILNQLYLISNDSI